MHITEILFFTLMCGLWLTSFTIVTIVIVDLLRERRAFYAYELPKATIEAIKQVRMAPRHDHLNELLE
jgi:hypothetical protein